MNMFESYPRIVSLQSTLHTCEIKSLYQLCKGTNKLISNDLGIWRWSD